MKRNLLFILMMLVSMMGTRIAVNAQNLTLSDVQNSGCQRGNQRRANGEGQTRTIVLLKEGNILSVQLLNYEANCGTEGFDVTPNMSGGSDGTQCSVNIQVVPVGEEDMDCICPYNVSFTVHGLEANSFRFNCWWFGGQVSLTEGEPLVLEDISESVNIDGVHYTLHKAMHTAKLANGKTKEGELIIPMEIYHEDMFYPVTRIEAYAFNGNSALTSVTIPNSVSSIGIAAFYRCSNLKDVYCYCEDKLPPTEGYTFTDAPIASATLHVPAGSVEKYKATAPWNEFGNIVGEGEVTIDGLNYYLDSSFYTAPLTKGNTWEGELDIPSEISFYGQTYRVTSMALTAFRNNTKLTKVRIPKNLEGILHGYYTTNPYEDVPDGLISPDCMNPFIGCTALESIEVDEENPSLKSVDGVLFSQDGKGYYYYLTNSYYGTGLYCYPAGARRESYTIPNGVEWIGSGAFGHNQYISTLTIPSSLKQICYNVFAGCNNLKDIYCYAENVPVAFSYVFKDFPIASATLHVPAGSVDAYKATAPWSGFGNIVAIEEIAQKYFPEGTKWTEIRLDTMKYDSWYSKVGDEWVPNFETIEYHVQGEFIDERTNDKYSCVYTNGQERTDSLTLLLYNHRIGNNDAGWYGEVTVAAFDNNGQLLWPFYGQMYPLSYEVGTPMSSLNILIAGATGGGWPWEEDEYGTVEEIKEGDFGGVRPLKYSDVNGIRFIQGIGVASWNDGECIFGPIRPYEVLSHLGAVEDEERHYRSMLVHFERDGEVLYDVWPEKPHQPLPLLEGNPIWEYKYEHIPTLRDPNIKCWIDTGERAYTYYFLGGQKELEGRAYTMMGEVRCDRDGKITFSRWLPVREENGIVYAFADSLPGLVNEDYDVRYNDEYNPMPYLRLGNECVLYNFSTDIGETLYPQNEGSTVKSIDTYQLLDGTECRVLKTQWAFYDLYEKLGLLNADPDFGIMDPFIGWPVSLNGHIYLNILNAYYQDNIMLYKAPDAREGLCVNDTCWTRDDAEAYARSYKADPRQEEVFSYIRRLQKASEAEPVTYTEGQMATIVLPTEPEPSRGKYYRLDRVEGNEIVFEQELQPRAHVPYIIVPHEDFSIEVSAMELEGLRCDTASVEGISFIGTYQKEEVESQEGFYIELIDTTPDCIAAVGERNAVIGALRAYLLVHWDDPYNHGGTKVPAEKMQIVLRDDPNSIQMVNGKSSNGKCYDLLGRQIPNRQSPHGIYIENGLKKSAK